jgi:hypothetical protein
VIVSVGLYATRGIYLHGTNSGGSQPPTEYHIQGNALDLSPILRLNTECLYCIMRGLVPAPNQIRVPIDISFPSTLVIDDTGTVSVKIGVSVNDKNVDYLPKLFPPSTLSLSATNFDISPNTSASITSNTKLPLTATWAISAKKAGHQTVILSISQDLIEKNKGLLETKFTLNGESRSNDDLRNIALPIEVRTVWGITNFQFNIISSIGAAFGFMLTLPLLTEWVKTRIARKRPDSSEA